MKKPLLLLFILVCLIPTTNCQIPTQYYNKGFVPQLPSGISNDWINIPIITMPDFDVEELLIEDLQRDTLDLPFRFGKGFDIPLTLADGIWTKTLCGRIWNLKIYSHGAYSINLVFDKIYLPEGGELYLYNEDRTVVYGPVTYLQSTKSEALFLTDIIPGNSITIEIFEPDNSFDKTNINVMRVVHGYKNINSFNTDLKSEDCYRNIACYPEWDESSDGVAMVLLSAGTYICTGSLLNNTAQNFRPFFLTAFHCIDQYPQNGVIISAEIDSAKNWLFRFQWKATQCNGSTAGTYKTYNGANYRASWNDADFALMELIENPMGNLEITWLGWDKSGDTPASGTLIHHPLGTGMRVTKDIDQLTETSYQSSIGQNYWKSDWDTSATNDGSSGAPLFDQNEKVVGQFRGGDKSCDNPDREGWSGCLYRSWTGGGDSTNQLSYWLDPCDLDPDTLSTIRSPYIQGHEYLCTTSKTYSLQNVPGNVEQINWTASPAMYFTTTSGSGTTLSTAWTGGVRRGRGTITATLVGDCDSINVSTTTWLGGPMRPSSIYFLTEDPLCRGSQYWYQFGTDVDDGTESWYWSLQPPGVIMGSNTGATIKFYYPGSTTPGEYSVGVKTVNPCGQSTDYIEYFDVADCGNKSFSFTIHPNPASDELMIEMIPDETLEVFHEVNTEIRLYDIYLSPKKQIFFQGNSTILNIGDIPNGSYLLQIKISGEKYKVRSDPEKITNSDVGDKVYWEKVQIQH